MSNLPGLSHLKSLGQFKTFAGSSSRTAKNPSASLRGSSDSYSLGSFANLKLTAGAYAYIHIYIYSNLAFDLKILENI